MKTKWLTNEEIKPFMVRSNMKAAMILSWTWLSIGLIFMLVAVAPSWPMYILAIVLLAGRQQALAAIMHEAGHNTFFANKKWNELTANWLSAPFILMDGKTYSQFHLLHHKWAGTEQDPDLPNYRHYPISKLSLTRKILRDLLGVTGAKLVAYLALTGKDPLSNQPRAPYTLTKGLLMNLGLFLLLYIFNQGALFVLWIVAYFTAYMLIVRFRQIAEHAGVQDLMSDDPKYNTRSLPQGVLGFLFFAPTQGLSYHCEHHAYMGVPAYHLKGVHKLLKEKGYYEDVPLRRGYWDIFSEIVK